MSGGIESKLPKTCIFFLTPCSWLIISTEAGSGRNEIAISDQS